MVYLLLLYSTLPWRRQVMFEGGKLETRQANIAVSPSYTSADLTPGIWGETGMNETFCILEDKEKQGDFSFCLEFFVQN